jgi:hypothetical protein
MGNRDLEYIVFDAARILPVYVIHLDWGENNKIHYIPIDRSEWQASARNTSRQYSELDPTMAGASEMMPGDRQRAREAVMARARKWFPYGYGPKSDGNFVVEDVGEVSDDEEDYGEFQAMRLDEGTEEKNADYWSWVKAGSIEDGENSRRHFQPLDEYRDDSRAGKAYGHSSLKWDNIPLPGEEKEEDPGIPEWFSSTLSR